MNVVDGTALPHHFQGTATVVWLVRHAETAASKYGLKTVDILVELGKRKMVGGQEDMIVDVALDLVKAF